MTTRERVLWKGMLADYPGVYQARLVTLEDDNLEEIDRDIETEQMRAGRWYPCYGHVRADVLRTVLLTLLDNPQSTVSRS